MLTNIYVRCPHNLHRILERMTDKTGMKTVGRLLSGLGEIGKRPEASRNVSSDRVSRVEPAAKDIFKLSISHV